ncbi:hypothetical protein Pla163_16110 [Planctomycetes bacterium Pla163]|uniref:DUF2339 domain-containing protein n=1 Tax=Rohdeia mirabilis TaxID=2528008 RepID=A0A518CZ49_9BACT|nr:hypothetical protein Pla163_16110 [Planctomycetes bacterium Pla163]
MILVLLYAATALLLFPVALALAIRAHGNATRLDRRVSALEREARTARGANRDAESSGRASTSARTHGTDDSPPGAIDEPVTVAHGGVGFDASADESVEDHAFTGDDAVDEPAVHEATAEPATAARTLAEIHADFAYRSGAVSGATDDGGSTPSIDRETGDLPRSGARAATERPPLHIERRPCAPPIEWERWLGVRGAALLGGIAAALAGLFFYRHAVEQGWITEVRRLAGGIGVGLSMIVVGDRVRPRGYRYAPEALLGAGLVVLYGAFWAASERYGLWPQLASFAAMGLNTALACWLSLRHGSRLIATLALIGGFATPFVVRLDGESPVGLFGYVLLLDLALLFVTSRKRAWSFLVPLALAGTTLVQASWTLRELDATTAAFGLVMLGAFGALFFWVTLERDRDHPDQRDQTSTWTLVGSVFVPFSFALYFATRVDLGERLWPLGILVNVLVAGACVCARDPRLSLASFGAVCSATAVYATWAAGRAASGLDLELVLHLLLLAAVPLVALELERRRVGRGTDSVTGTQIDRPRIPGVAGTTLRGRALVIAVLGAVLGAFGLLQQSIWNGTAADLWPAALVLALLLGVCARASLATASQREFGPVGVAVVTLGVVRLAFLHASPSGAQLSLASVALVTTGFALALVALAFGRSDHSGSLEHDGRTPSAVESSKSRAQAVVRAGIFVAVLFSALPIAARGRDWSTGQLVVLELILLAIALASLARVRLGAASGFVAVLLPLALLSVTAAAWPTSTTEAGLVLGFAIVGAVLTAAFVLLGSRIAERAPSTAQDESHTLEGFGARAHLGLTAALGLIALADVIPTSVLAPSWRFPLAFLPLAALATLVAHGAARLARTHRLSPDPWRTHSGLVAVLVGATLGLHVDRFPAATTPALVALCLTVVLRRTGDRRFVPLIASAVVIATVALVGALALGRPLVAGAHWLVDELAYTHLVPAAAALFLAHGLRPNSRRPPFDARRPRAIAGACGALIGFIWISLCVVRLYVEAGDPLTIPTASDQAAHLALSTSWAGYALVLLAVGTFTGERAAGARWASLIVLLVAIAKVFLYDLGDLDGLRRVASLGGLALTLLVVSFGYQRFVFGIARDEPPGASDGNGDGASK